MKRADPQKFEWFFKKLTQFQTNEVILVESPGLEIKGISIPELLKDQPWTVWLFLHPLVSKLTRRPKQLSGTFRHVLHLCIQVYRLNSLSPKQEHVLDQ